MARSDEVLLVDESDRVLGEAERWEAHTSPGRLHRAFSVMIFNRRGEVLLQRRALGKRTFAGLWGNTCCGHPAKGVAVAEAAATRLEEEMGVAADLEPVGWFVYRAEDVTSGLVEHEFDHVLRGSFDGEPEADPEEAMEWAWVAPEELLERLAASRGEFVPWMDGVVRTLFGPASQPGEE